MIPYYMPVKNWVTTAVVTGSVAITKAKWYMILSGVDCSSTGTTSAGSLPAGCISAAL